MTRGMRLLIMVLILIAIVAGMMQCMQKTMGGKKPLPEAGRAPADTQYPAGKDP